MLSMGEVFLFVPRLSSYSLWSMVIFPKRCLAYFPISIFMELLMIKGDELAAAQ